MRNTNLTKLKSLGFLFWKPKERISEKTKKKDDLFLLNGNILVVIPHGTNNQIISSGYEDFFVSVSKAFDIKKGFFNQIKDLNLHNQNLPKSIRWLVLKILMLDVCRISLCSYLYKCYIGWFTSRLGNYSMSSVIHTILSFICY